MKFENAFNNWMTRLNKLEKPNRSISAFNFGLFETPDRYTLYLIGANHFDEEDEDWATEIDFEPQEKYLAIDSEETNGLEWNQVLDKVTTTVTKYIHSPDFKESILNKAHAITTGFDDGNLIRIK